MIIANYFVINFIKARRDIIDCMIIGVDTGGTKTLVAIFDNDGNLQKQQKFMTPKDVPTYIEQVASTIEALTSNRSEIIGIGIAVPGLVENQTVVVCKNLGWRNVDIIGRLNQHFPQVPMWMENDANLGGLGSCWLMPNQPKRLLYLTISTGVNISLIIDGKISLDVPSAEAGDMTFEHKGELKTWEELSSGGAIMSEYGVYASEVVEPSDIADISEKIAKGLMILLPVLRPDIVAVGGGVGAHFDMFADDIEGHLAAIKEDYRCPVTTAPYPEEIVAYGCYFYAKHKLSL